MQVVYVACIFTFLFCSCYGYPGNYFRDRAVVAGATFFPENNVKVSEADLDNNVVRGQQFPENDVRGQQYPSDAVHRQQYPENDVRGQQYPEYPEYPGKDMARISQFSALRLFGGEHSCEGRLEFIDRTLQARQVCDLNFGNEEAQVVCSDLGCSSHGARRVDSEMFGFSAAVNFYATLGYECTGNESTILDCKNVGADCTTDSAEHAVAVICGGQPGELLRLVGGSNPCEGRLVTLRANGDYGQACNLFIGDSEAQVVCRQLGCEASGAQRVHPIQFGFSRAIGRYNLFGVDCTGEENNLRECSRRPGFCRIDNQFTAVAIKCGTPLIGIQKGK